MSKLFEEIDYCPTPIGPVILRRRRVLALGEDVYEILLGEEHLMSSLFTVSEIALARLGLAPLAGREIDVLVGGLGLGYTARAVLEHDNVRSLVVVEMLEPVIDWHERGLLPLDPPLSADPRCRFVRGDFFALSASADGFDPDRPRRRFDAILIDIDHAPDRLLDGRSGSFYSREGFERLSAHLHPGGIMGLWSDDRADEAFVARLAGVFDEVRAEPVTFRNPLQEDREFTQTVYVARKSA
ncbi:spermidine synthase [Oricola thermophila]|uniref:Spermidine synthase n=1 Tax=Oricola thermophila TaxID=2742145 RepID=A0A6N1VFN1_9HYPH|nr:spermidine synthase [Oricola thermophila]QKV19721.1 spermidine synthase [Oricola thermophila]